MNTLLAAIAATLALVGPACAAPREVVLSTDQVELVGGEWDYLPALITIGGVEHRGYGYPLGAAQFRVAGYERLQAMVGILDTEKFDRNVTIELDGLLVWQARLRAGSPARRIDLPLGGKETLTLRSNSTNAVFAEPRLIQNTRADADPNGPMRGGLLPRQGPLAGELVYHNSYALLIGVNEHTVLPRDVWRETAANDVEDLRAVLQDSYGFPPENIVSLVGREATRLNIQRRLEFYRDAQWIDAQDRVLVYFAGPTRTVAVDGRQTAYLLPYDADVDPSSTEVAAPYQQSCIDVSEVITGLDTSPAKHTLLLLDGCFGGFEVDADAAPSDVSAEGLKASAQMIARQMIAAGGAAQSYPDNPALGHPIFTYQLLEALKRGADVPGAVITASQLYEALRLKVNAGTRARQVPWMSKSASPGEFLFVTAQLYGALREYKRLPSGSRPVEGPEGHYYLGMRVEGGLPWTEAANSAASYMYKDLPGHLVTITSGEEQRFLQRVMKQACTENFWLGGYQDPQSETYSEPSGGWRWVTDEPWEFSLWNHGFAKEPNNSSPNENHLCFASAGTWNDDVDNSMHAGYVIEFEPRRDLFMP